MMYWKRSIPYEVRKGIHYLFYLFAIGLCFHAPPSVIPKGGFIAYVMGFCICVYMMDASYVFFFMTEKIDTTQFQVLGGGVLMTMHVSASFQRRGKNGGFAYVCLPWVARDQWHAFSLFEHPAEPNKRQVFMLKAGDWTNAVHEALQRKAVRPVWVQGPFVSPYNAAEDFDNHILVASGIGITPALSVIQAHKDSRRINLIWAVRYPSMLEFFLDHLYLCHDGWNIIYYSGKAPLNPALEDLTWSNVRVIKGRPDLETVIVNIVYGIESSVGKPEAYTPGERTRVEALILEHIEELDTMFADEHQQKIVELTMFASSHGFILWDLMTEKEKVKNDIENQINLFHNEQHRTSAYELGIDKYSDHPSSISFNVVEYASDLGVVKSDNDLSAPQFNEILSTGPAAENIVISASDKNLNTVPDAENNYGFGYPTEMPSELNKIQHRNRSLDLSNLHRTKYRKRSMGSRNFHDHDSGLRCGSFRNIFDDEEVRSGIIFSNSSGFQVEKKVSNLRSMLMRKESIIVGSSFTPSDKKHFKEAENFLQNLDKKSVLSTWGILYCGGNKLVSKDLKLISEKYNVALNLETFAW